MVYTKEDILCKKIEDSRIPNDIKAIPIEINIRKQKVLLLPIYRSPTQDSQYFIENIFTIIDKHTLTREKVLLIGDFNMEMNDKEMGNLINAYNLFSLSKGPTCFRIFKRRSIDLMLTNNKHSFMKSQSLKRDSVIIVILCMQY